MAGTATTPAGERLFKVSNNPQILDNGANIYFHKMTVKLIFISKRARTDLQGAVSFLSNRLKGPDMDYYKNLGILIKYLRWDT